MLCVEAGLQSNASRCEFLESLGFVKYISRRMQMLAHCARRLCRCSQLDCLWPHLLGNRKKLQLPRGRSGKLCPLTFELGELIAVRPFWTLSERRDHPHKLVEFDQRIKHDQVAVMQRFSSRLSLFFSSNIVMRPWVSVVAVAGIWNLNII
jgi:hypothetical protein